MKLINIFWLISILIVISGCAISEGWVEAADSYTECGRYKTGSDEHLYCLDELYKR